MARRIRANIASTARNPIGAPMPSPRPFEEMGVSGTAIYSGFINQKDKAAAWRGTKRYETSADILTNISIVAASVRFFLNLIAYPKWTVVPVSDSDPEARQYAEFVEDVLHDTEAPLSQLIRRSGTYQFHGFGVQEWTAKKREDGKTGFKSIESRQQHTIERWSVTESGSVEGVWQRSPQTNQLLPIPRKKFIYLVDDTFTDSPEGLGIFRNLLEPYARFKKFLELETRTFERDLRGIPIGRAPIGAIKRAIKANVISESVGEDLITQMKRAVEIQVKDSNTGVLLDSQPFESQAQDGAKISSMLQWDLSLLQGNANGLVELAKAIDRLQREMARIIGTEQLMMGDQGGNRALSLDKSRNLYLIANSVLGNIVSSFERDLLTPLWMMNGLPEEKKPRLQAEDVAFKDVMEITGALKEMASAGAVLEPNDPAIDDVRDLLGVSRPIVSDELAGMTETEPDDELDEGELEIPEEELEEV